MLQLRHLLREELPEPAARPARWLIGKTLVREHPAGRMSGRIVETEAYVVGDASGHAYQGKTARNASLFLERGHAYVYFVYGCWFSLHVSAGRIGIGSAVLLRALEPLEGLEMMAANRPGARPTDLARGPGRLATALGITRDLDGQDLCGNSGPLWLADALRKRGRIAVGRRIGISEETHRLLRFFEVGNLSVSGPRSFRP
jgi:DNA-3-methyladenine glycosylase